MAAAAPRLTLTPTELAAVVRLLGRGRSLADCLRRIELQRGLFTEARVDLAPRRTVTRTRTQDR
jgi:hypothetical protein